MDVMKYNPDKPVQYVPIQSITIPVTTTGASPISGDLLLAGWNLVESTGAAPATVDFYDGGDASGQFLARVTLLANQTTVDPMPFPGIYCTRGLFINVVAGSVRGAVWIRDV